MQNPLSQGLREVSRNFAMEEFPRRPRGTLAIKGFALTAHYDTAIHNYLKKQA